MTERQLNKWWGNTDFRQMERITKTKDYWFSEEDGNQEFVDFCDNWWKGLSKEDKKDVYGEYN
ncbi:hypothetical protein FACS1894162_2790 [Bacteroidia bacterium]|nr:hypothetical protein FACS1894162_2790 [Bacteroidia bacterium]